jgi:hypothetical protein
MPNLSRPGDVELHFEERGDGPLVVLAPYWSGQPDVYEGFLSDLSRDHRIVTWDARGTGESTHEGPYDLETDSSDLEAVLEHLGAGSDRRRQRLQRRHPRRRAERRPDRHGAGVRRRAVLAE